MKRDDGKMKRSTNKESTHTSASDVVCSLVNSMEEIYLALGAKPKWRPGPRCFNCGFEEAPWWDLSLWKPARKRKEEGREEEEEQ